MAYGPDGERGKWADPLRFVNISKINIDDIENMLKVWCSNKSIPASFSKSDYVTGSFFSKSSTPLLLIKNPNVDCSFFTLGIYANGNTLSFPLFGESAENTKNNKYEYYKNQGTGLRAMLYKPDTLKLQQEYMWQQDIFAAFDEE